MDVKAFIKKNRKNWSELEQLNKAMRKRRTLRTPEQIDRFQHLYEMTAQHLSYSQTYFPNEAVTRYLNGVVSRAHNLFYRDQMTSFQQLRTFFGHTFITLLLEQRRFIGLAFLLFLIGAVGAFYPCLMIPSISFPFYPIKSQKGSILNKSGHIMARLTRPPFQRVL